MKKTLISSILLLFPLIAFFCGSAENVLTKKDQGETILLPVNAGFSVELDANPSTGYDWGIIEIDGFIIEFRDRTFTAIDSNPGSGGTDHFNFSTLKKGSSQLKLGYYRAFEGMSSMIDSFEVDVVVR